MTISYHPEPENLLTCSAGAMPEALAAVMASHLDMCPDCRREISILESIGGVLLEDLQPVLLSHGAMATAKDGGARIFSSSAAQATDVPRPIQRFVGPTLGSVRWRRVVPGIWQYAIPLSPPSNSSASLRLMKVSPGLALPDHGHSGPEMTLILQGAFRDKGVTYRPGDFIELDNSAGHAPIADSSGECICLVATGGRMRFRSFITRTVRRFLGL
jgi:putative transcriptional regulator